MRDLTALVLPSLWAMVVVAGAWRHRPAPTRVLALVGAGVGRATPSPVGRLGGLIRRSAGRAADPARDRRAGWSALGTVLALAVSPIVALGVAAASVLSARIAEQRQRRRAEEAVLASVPETIDLFVLTASAGHPVQRSLQMVATRAGEPIGRELRAAVRRVEHGERTADALEQAAETLGEPVRPLVERAVFVRAVRHASGPCARAAGRRGSDGSAATRRGGGPSRPDQVALPLVLCTLPAFALLTVVPLLIGAFDSLRV